MAKRGRVRTIYRRGRTITRRARSSGIGGKFKPAIAGAACSAGSNLASGYLGAWAPPVVCGAVGYLMNDKTAMFFAGYHAGNMLLGGNGGAQLGGVR